MADTPAKSGIIIPCWDTLRQHDAAFAAFMRHIDALCADGRGVLILSRAPTRAVSTILHDTAPRSYLADARTLSPLRLSRLCDALYTFDDGALCAASIQTALPVQAAPRFGYVVSNGFGLGHVTRMHAVAEGLNNYGPHAYMSFSGGLVKSPDGAPVYYLPSAQYLELDAADDHAYNREATLRFLNIFMPSHLFYDGNVLPSGLLSALAARPDIHLTWVRRGMWQQGVAPRYMAQQAMADLVIEPGDLSDSYDHGPSWQQRLAYCPPRAFLKTAPVKPRLPEGAMAARDDALKALGLPSTKRYALLMLGACQKSDDNRATLQAVEAVKSLGMVPVVAHWPISHDAPPVIQGTIVIEKMPIATYYKAFDVLVSAAGYNSFHEILAIDVPAVFVPQEDAGRDQQVMRAQYAADHKLAILCRRHAIDTLPAAITAAMALPPRTKPIEWLDDWTVMAGALGVATPPVYKVHKAQAESLPGDLRLATLPTLLKRIHGRWRQKHKPYANQFILAFDTSFQDLENASKKIGTTYTNIVITNSIDPIALRRHGYKYIWLNTGFTGQKQGLYRQFLGWLHIWRPIRVINITKNSLFSWP